MDSVRCALCQKPPKDNIQLSCSHQMCYSCAELYADMLNHRGKEVKLIHCRKCSSETVVENINDLRIYEMENFISFNQQISSGDKLSFENFQPAVTDFNIEHDQFEQLLQQQMSHWSSKQSDETKQDLQTLNLMLEQQTITQESPRISNLKTELVPVSERQTEMASSRTRSINLSLTPHKVSIPKATLTCQKHDSTYQLICLTCKQLCCMKCVLKEKLHSTHKVLTLSEYVSKKDLPKEFDRKQMKVIEDQIRVLEQNEQLIKNTFKSYSDKVNIEFQRVINQVKERQSQIAEQIQKFFLLAQNQINEQRQHLEFLRASAEQYRLIYDQKINGDDSVDQTDIFLFLTVLVQATKTMEQIPQLHQEELMILDFPTKQQLLDVISRYGRFSKSKKLQLKQSRLDISVTTPQKQTTQLFSESQILNPNLVLLANQQKIFYGIKQTKLLYSMKKHDEQDVYQLVGDHHPLIVVLRVKREYVFGCYIPTPMNPLDKYYSTQDSYIFSLQNHHKTKPVRITIKPDKEFIALFLGPQFICLGSTLQGRQDLLIHFQQPQKSCSNIGYAYKCDPKIDGQRFLAGSFTNWELTGLEIFHVQ